MKIEREKGSEDLKRRVKLVVERTYGKLELQCLLERDDMSRQRGWPPPAGEGS